jgi:hypothetical protein
MGGAGALQHTTLPAVLRGKTDEGGTRRCHRDNLGADERFCACAEISGTSQPVAHFGMGDYRWGLQMRDANRNNPPTEALERCWVAGRTRVEVPHDAEVRMSSPLGGACCEIVVPM